MKTGTFKILVWYHAFGLCHEIAHMVAAWGLGVWSPPPSSLPLMLVKAFFGRACELPVESSDATTIHHAGWIASLILAVLGTAFSSSSSSTSKNNGSFFSASEACRLAAWITFAEAFCTDFVGIGGVADVAGQLFYCGNFGLILVNPAWIKEDKGRKALDMIEQMVHITMMRGAQSGGVVAWNVHGDSGKATGIRSRVVNGKRTDLSKGIRKKILRDSFSRGGAIQPSIQTFLGHTRFATSSKATLDGTHPHQWTPPQSRRIYDFHSVSEKKSFTPTVKSGVIVENFITHNGDLDFFCVNGDQFDLETVRDFVAKATGFPSPSNVDSVVIAGLVDMIRTAGCFGLSIRYNLMMNCASSTMEVAGRELPSYKEYEMLGNVFEDSLALTCSKANIGISDMQRSVDHRQLFASNVYRELEHFIMFGAKNSTLASFVSTDGEDTSKASLYELISGTIDAFFDNDLFHTIQTFMANAKGSFGLMITSSLDAHRQICVAARGQPMSLTLYPKTGAIVYGSELAAAKVGIGVNPSKESQSTNTMTILTDDEEKELETTSRVDLDDLGGESAIIDWCCGPGDRNVEVLLRNETKTTRSSLSTRLVLLEANENIIAVKPEAKDPVLNDIQDIPYVCKQIQNNWKKVGLNRYTAWNLLRKLKNRLRSRSAGSIPSDAVDILLTGCETSLWLSEQFASDLRKAFPKLNISAVSSNKLLGVFGQDLPMAATGYPLSPNVPDLKGAIIIIVSHSGQTFAPLACSSLLQSFTEDIFLVTSEWDTQIGRQLRSISLRRKQLGSSDVESMFGSRIFSTDVGLRPAEPCSVSVAATQQLLTQMFMHISISLLGDTELRAFCGAVISEYDLKILERCNQTTIASLQKITGGSARGGLMQAQDSVEVLLRSAGRKWAQHVLENIEASILTFIYIMGTVVSGYPVVSGIATAAGLQANWAFYICRFFDSIIYFYFHQFTVFAIRILQGRNLRHRTGARTVVVGDCPWVSQSADAFLSKLFACSYPMAGITVLSGNPADHLVHRHTHRVVRGTLLVCGRPDGRLSALTNSEVSVCLSVNQASSIQNIGGTCESMTIGHNPSKMSSTVNDIFIGNNRPQFLCERLVETSDGYPLKDDSFVDDSAVSNRSRKFSRRPEVPEGPLEKSALELKGVYGNMQKPDIEEVGGESTVFTFANQTEQDVLDTMLSERQGTHMMREIFDQLDTRDIGVVGVDAIVGMNREANGQLSDEQMRQVIKRVSKGRRDGLITFAEFCKISNLPDVEVLREIQISAPVDGTGLVTIQATQEDYFGQDARRKSSLKVEDFSLAASQHFAMELYESRIASLERFVSMCVMFHEMGRRVENFFSKWSLGFAGYRMDRTHSIMRVATTASPVSGADVRERMETLQVRARIQNSIRVIESSWSRYQKRQINEWKKQNVKGKTKAKTTRADEPSKLQADDASKFQADSADAASAEDFLLMINDGDTHLSARPSMSRALSGGSFSTLRSGNSNSNSNSTGSIRKMGMRGQRRRPSRQRSGQRLVNLAVARIEYKPDKTK